MRPPKIIRTLAEVSAVAVSSSLGGDLAGDLTRTALDNLRLATATDIAGLAVKVLLGQDDTTAVLAGDNADTLVIDNARILVAVDRGEVSGLAREDATETLLLHKEAVVLARDKPLEILRRHGGVWEEIARTLCNNYITHVSQPRALRHDHRGAIRARHPGRAVCGAFLLTDRRRCAHWRARCGCGTNAGEIPGVAVVRLR